MVNSDIYYTSPVIFKTEEVENEPAFGKYTYYIGLNEMVEVEEGAPFKQLDFLELTPAIYVRCAEIEELEEAYELLKSHAEQHGLELEDSFYHVCFDAFDSVMMDIYAIVKEG